MLIFVPSSALEPGIKGLIDKRAVALKAVAAQNRIFFAFIKNLPGISGIP
jgi:hypothetical protein